MRSSLVKQVISFQLSVVAANKFVRRVTDGR